MAGFTYKQAGVDADKGDLLVERIKGPASKTHRAGLLEGIGGFASLFSLKEGTRQMGELEDPVLVSGTDGVGTKLKLAFRTGRHDTVGIDLVAMCVNDVITTGADPLFFLDYFGTGALEISVAEAVIRGIARGCELAGCALVGGETAELPGLYRPGEYDLAGFAVGVVDRKKIVDGKKVTPGDVIIGVKSHGIHSNGLSLAQAVLFDHAHLDLSAPVEGGALCLGDELMRPTAIYVSMVRTLRTQVDVKAMAHITGGGLPGNVPRVLPAGVRAEISRKSFSRPPVYSLIQRAGGVEEAEMYRTFNMGLGFIVVVSPSQVQAAVDSILSSGEEACVVGEVARDAGPEAGFLFVD